MLDGKIALALVERHAGLSQSRFDSGSDRVFSGAELCRLREEARRMTYDVAIAGLGGIGSAIAAQCAARGASVIGLEQFGPVHDLGSSHGRSRMIRQAYFEDAAYVPLVLR